MSSDDVVAPDHDRVLGRTDGNLSNYLWDGSRIRIVDFEDSGVSDIAFELAESIEHPSTWVDSHLDAPELLAHFDLDRSRAARLRRLRRLVAVQWLTMLLPGGVGHSRNPAGTDKRQAERLLTLLSSD